MQETFVSPVDRGQIAGSLRSHHEDKHREDARVKNASGKTDVEDDELDETVYTPPLAQVKGSSPKGNRSLTHPLQDMSVPIAIDSRTLNLLRRAAEAQPKNLPTNATTQRRIV